MFDVNLWNKPGEQHKNTTDNSISFDVDTVDIIDEKINNKEIADNLSENSKKKDWFPVLVIILIIGIIISVLLGYYFRKIWLE